MTDISTDQAIADIYVKAMRRAEGEVAALIRQRQAESDPERVTPRVGDAELAQLFDYLHRCGGGAMVKEVQRRKKYDRRGLDRLIEAFREADGQVFTVRYRAGGQVGLLLALPGVDPRPLVPADAELKDDV